MTLKNSQACVSAEGLKQLSQGELSPEEVDAIEDHVSGCDRCRKLLAVHESDPQWQDQIVPILRTALESPRVSDDRDAEGESLESVLSLLGPTDDPRMLGRIGSYEVVGVVGRGGMGVVFKAFEAALNRFVAIKMLLPHLAASGAARKRFAREGQAAAAVIDDNVMPIYSVAEWQGAPYLVTQYSRGSTLQKRIQDQGPLELKEILRIGMQTARGLAAAHAQGIVHRDVKPSNILLDGTVERALLTDFGLARAVDDASITRTGVIAGTPQYMSPEQARGGSVDARSDLFSLGCVLYAMCAGHPPFRADSSYAILRMIADDEPRSIREVNSEIPEWLCLLISRLMAKSPDDRFGGALEVAQLLEQCLAHVQQPTSVALPGWLSRPRSATDARRRKTLVIGVLVMFASLALGLVATFARLGVSPPENSDRSVDGAREAVVAQETQEAEKPRPDKPNDAGLLQGSWAFVSIEGGRPDGKTTKRAFEGGQELYAFEGKKLLLKSVDDDGNARTTSEFDIALDTTAHPHRLTVHATKDRRSIRYIYEVKGDTLRMCFFALGEVDGKEVVAWPLEFSIDKSVEKWPTLLTLKRVGDVHEGVKEVGGRPAPDAAKVAAVAPPPESPDVFPLFELRLAYFEPGADRTEHAVPDAEQKIYVASQALASIADVVAARAIEDASGKPAIEINFSHESAKRIEEWTQQHLNQPVAVMVDGKVLAAPTIREQFGSASIIMGRFSREETERIAGKLEKAIALFRHAVSDFDAGPVWGETVDGLQLAVRGIHQDRRFNSGDTIRFRLSVRNVGTETIRFRYRPPKTCYWTAPLLERANGEPVRIPSVAFRGGHNTFTETLEPQAEASIHVSGILVLGEPNAAGKWWPRLEKPEPGEYKLRAAHMIHPLDADGEEIVERNAEGTRIVKHLILTSGTVAIQIEDAASASR